MSDMTTMRKILIACATMAALTVAMIDAAQARRYARYHHYRYHYGYWPAYSYRHYGGYYGAARGYGRCHVEMEGHLGPKTCAYRY